MDTEEGEPVEHSQTIAAVTLGNSNDDIKGATQAEIQLIQREDSTEVAKTLSNDKQELTDNSSTSSLPVVSVNEKRQDDATIAIMTEKEKPTMLKYEAEQEDAVITAEKKESKYEAKQEDAVITAEKEAPSREDLYRGDDAVVVHSDAAFLVPKQRPTSSHSRSSEAVSSKMGKSSL